MSVADPGMQTLVPSEILHKDGSLWARGQTLDGEMHGLWQWFRKGGGAIMRSGHFDRGAQVGEWTTYDNGRASSRDGDEAEEGEELKC